MTASREQNRSISVSVTYVRHRWDMPRPRDTRILLELERLKKEARVAIERSRQVLDNSVREEATQDNQPEAKPGKAHRDRS